MFDILREVNDFESELLALRRDFHENPELGFNEFRTSQIIYDYLKKLNIEVKNIAKTGVVGVLHGKNGEEGRTVLLRANMDAFPTDELTELPFKSKYQGVMHAAGHDAQMSILLVVAKMLSRHRDEFNGNVKFIFQPNEEGTGALDMINAGILEAPKVDAAFAIDFSNEGEIGTAGLSSGVVLGATEEFEIKIFGKTANTSVPHMGKDAILAAAKIIENLQLLETREFNPVYPFTITVGHIHGGNVRNMVSDHVEMGGTIRFLFPDEEESKLKIISSFKRVGKSICDMCMVDYDVTFIQGYPFLVNNHDLVEVAKESLNETYTGKEQIVEIKGLIGEDFSEISQRIPSVLVFLGMNNVDKGIIYPLYHPKFTIDEDVMKYGVQFFVRSTLKVLNFKENSNNFDMN